MSCNGCRVLRKGCSEACVLRPCLRWIDGADAQGHATLFVAKFFGRAGLMSFLAAVPEPRRPALFRSLLFEACGRTINPVEGAVGLLATGRWRLCQEAVEAVLRGGVVRQVTDVGNDAVVDMMADVVAVEDIAGAAGTSPAPLPPSTCHLELSLSPWAAEGGGIAEEAAPSASSEGSVTSTGEGGDGGASRMRLLNLFV